MTARFFVSSPLDGDRAVLTDAEAHHLLHVLRADVGDEVVIFDGSGVECTARVVKKSRSTVDLEIVERRTADRELGRRIELAAPLPKGDRQRWLIEKAVELGVARFIPLTTARSVSRPEPQALERLRRAVVEASKQCRRNRLMEIAAPVAANDYFQEPADDAIRWLAHLPTSPPAGCVADDPEESPGGPSTSSLAVLAVERRRAAEEQSTAPVRLAIGPEGGWTDEEAALAESLGWTVVGLGATILRLETAALALVARFAVLPTLRSTP